VEQFVNLTILGLATAAIFALAASGLVLTYTTTGIFNFSHGAIGMLGAYAYWQLRVDWGWPAPVALGIVLGVLAPLLGVVIERGIMRGLTDAPETVRLVVSISLLVAMLGIGVWVWSPQEAYPTRLFFQGNRIDVLGVVVTWHELIAFGVAVACAVGLRLLLFRTRTGLDMRASVDSRPLAMLHGARPDRSATYAWAIGASLAALAGILIAPMQSMSHTYLTLLIVSAYAAAMIGRLRSIPLTFAGAVLLGLADSYAIGYIPTSNTYFSSFRFVLPVVALFVALIVLRQPALRVGAMQASREHIPMPTWPRALATGGVVIAAGVFLANLLTPSDALGVSRILGLAIIALSLVPLVGLAGQMSLAQMSFAGIGAIVMAHHGHGGDPLALVYAAVLCAAIGALVALPALRLSGIYLALATAAFAVFLDRWVFNLPAFDLGPWRIKFFEGGNIAVSSVDVPGITDTRSTQITTLAVFFSLTYLLVVAVRRGRFGQRLLAMKSSPAAAATLGMDTTRTKLAVFALSAAIAGVGGALYAGTQGVVSPDRFSLFEGLPLLLLTVVGGISTASGALFAGVFLGGYPIAVGIWPWLSSLNRVLPGTMGIALARNPNGAVGEMASSYRVLLLAPLILAGLAAVLVAAAIAAVAGTITGWAFTWITALALVIAPQLAALRTARSAPVDPTASDTATTPTGAGSLAPEWAGIDAPLGDDEVERIDRFLALERSR
jgi:branched-chain amino acid transport system permease protein